MKARPRPACPGCGSTVSRVIEDVERPAMECMKPVRRCAQCGTYWRETIPLWMPVTMLLAGAVLFVVGGIFAYPRVFPLGVGHRLGKFEFALVTAPFFLGLAMIWVGWSCLTLGGRKAKLYGKTAPPKSEE